MPTFRKYHVVEALR